MVQSLDSARENARDYSGGDTRRPGGGGRIPPHNLEAEESLIGAMMLSREALTAAVEAHIEGRDFYKPAHGVIYDAAFMLHSRGEPVDPVTVSEELRRSGQLDAIGGRPALLRIQAATPASANAAQYANIVSELSMLRKLIETAADIQHMAFDVDDDVDETLDRAESMIFEVAEKRVSDSLVPLYPVLEQTLVQLEALYDRDSSITGVPTGFHDLDDLLLGLQPSTLNVLAARPGQGKTSLALGAALHCALVAAQAGAVLLDGDGPPRAHEATARGRGRHRSAQALDGTPQRARVAEVAPGRRPARRSAVLHRRQPALHGDGDAGQGAPHACALR